MLRFIVMGKGGGRKDETKKKCIIGKDRAMNRGEKARRGVRGGGGK